MSPISKSASSNRVIAMVAALGMLPAIASAQPTRSAPTLSGRLVTEAGAPVPDVLVTLYSGVATRFRGQRVGTDENGQFSFDPLRTGARVRRDNGTAYRFTGVQLSHPEFVPADGRSWRDVEVPIRGGAETLNLVMTRGGAVNGVVADRDSGEPLAGLELRIHNGDAGSADTGPFRVDATTDEQGAFAAGPLFPGEYVVEINDANYLGKLPYPRLARAEVEAGETINLELVDRPAPPPAPTPEPPPAQVAAAPTPMPAPTPTRRWTPIPRVVEVEAPVAPPRDPDAATVSDELGAPVERANVLVASRMEDGSRRVEAFLTDARGEFPFVSEKGAMCRARVAARDFLPFTSSFRRPELLRKLTVIKATPGYGVVRLPDGGPIAARLYTRLEKLNRDDEPSYLRGVGEVLTTTKTTNGLNGRFALNELPEEPIDLIVEAVDGTRVIVRQVEREEDLQFVLPDRRDFVVGVNGDLAPLRATGATPRVALLQTVQLAGADGVQRNYQIVSVRPIESRNGENYAIFHGLVTDLMDPSAKLKVTVGVVPGESRPKQFDVPADKSVGVTLEL